MILKLDAMKEITCGAAVISEDEESISFFRFTEEQSEQYRKNRNIDFYKKTFATAGVRLAFRTDSNRISFDYKLAFGSSRLFGWFDVYENGVLTAHFGEDGKLFAAEKAEIKLSGGENTVEIYFPWSRAASISNFELDDGAVLVPVKRKHSMLCFGDSITHGYDAVFPSLTYTSQLSRLLGADSINKAIGGDTFFPELLDPEEAVDPDYITVAYGTNDWNVSTREVFEFSCRKFIYRLTVKYPKAKIFVITPIWRGDGDRETKFGAPVTETDALIRTLCEDLGNVAVIDGRQLTPHCAEFYSDKYLHPNDIGFGVYSQNLYAEIAKRL